MKCRHCKSELKLSLVDLGSAPPSNSYLTEHTLQAPEKWFPLRVLVCEQCWLVQTEDFTQVDELFDSNYAYFSGFSESWLAHSERYVNDMVAKFGLNAKSHIVEVAANDGYLLQYIKAHGIPCTGVEPTAATAAAARAKGITIVEKFFGLHLAQTLTAEGKQADLTVANNVLAHVPDINDFVAGFAVLLKEHGVATFEFPHLQKLIAETQFDTIYHEHFSYLSLTTVQRVFASNGLTVFDVEDLPTHGGSLRVYAQRANTGRRATGSHVAQVLETERDSGMLIAEHYQDFQARTDRIKHELTYFLLDARRDGKRVAAYGAAAKGNTLLNYAGIRTDLIDFVVDRNPAKQHKYMPGSRIPIVSEERLKEEKPDYVLILPWNLKSELEIQLSYVNEWGGRLVIAVPYLEIL
jgi:2-polyprenyl-3-methyl-5-hydroxy-6-metoxy-1,4-benzoquinol methylase